MGIKTYIIQRDEVKKGLLKDSIPQHYLGEASIGFVNFEYGQFLYICKNPGVRTVLELYASLAEPKQLLHKLTATVQAHSAELTRTSLPNNKVLTLSVSGRPGEPGVMKVAKMLTTPRKTTKRSAELDHRNYSWKMTIFKKLVESSIDGILANAPYRFHTYIHKLAKPHRPKIYGIDFWWSWYIHKFGLYEVPTEETNTALYDEYAELYSKIHGAPTTVESAAHLLLIKTQILNSTDTAANLYNLARFLRTAWADVGITFPGGGFKVICAHRDHEHSLKPHKGEDPDLCPCYGISVVETTNPADLEFTNKGLPFLKGNAASIQEYIMNPHLVDGANFAPMPDKMLENVKATHDTRRTTTGANVNLLDQQLYWLNKILVFCEKRPNEMVYYALLFLEMCVERKTCHSAMINMFQHGMGYVFTCLDPSCRHITNLRGNAFPVVALQIVEYKDDLRVVKKIVATRPQPEQTQSELCHYVERRYNNGGIWATGDTGLAQNDDSSLELVKTEYESVVADTVAENSDTRIRKFIEIMTRNLKLSEESLRHIKLHDVIFTRIKKLFLLNLGRRTRDSSYNRDRDDSKRHRPNVGGKISSTRKRVLSMTIRRRSYRKHRPKCSRKNKHCIRYTNKNKK